MEIYRRLYPRAPSNSEYAESYVRAGESSWDVAPVIPYLVRLFDPAVDPVFKPLNFPFETLREKHAKFLAMTDDVLQLRLLAFKVGPAVKMGRVPEEVPYLRELAPLLEREGDMPGALAAWEQLSNLWPDEEEATVHRARILVSQGNRERALEALRKLPLNNLWSEQERAGLELRVKLAADAGLWSEVRDLMNIVATPPVSPTGTAPVHQTNTVAVVAVSRVLADHQRTEEARSLLIRAERGAKDEVDRFRLRMEQLEVESRAPSWSPSADPARVLATVRMNVSDEAALKEWRDWMKREADLPRAKAWFDLLNNAEPNINTALGLAALNLAAKAKVFVPA